MSKNKALKIVNAALMVLIVNQAGSALLFSKKVISYQLFEWMHERAAFVLLTVAAVHLILNWNWVRANYFRKKS